MSIDSEILSGSFQTEELTGFDSEILSGQFTTIGPDVVGPETMTSGATVTLTVSNFDGAITSASIAGIDVSASISQEGDQVTIDVPDMFEEGLERKPQTVVLGDGADTADDDILLVQPAGWFYVVLDGYDELEEGVESMADDSELALSDGDWLYYYDPNEYLDVDSAGVASMDAEDAPQTFQRIAYFPDDPEGIDGVYSEMGGYVISEMGALVEIAAAGYSYTGQQFATSFATNVEVAEAAFAYAGGQFNLIKARTVNITHGMYRYTRRALLVSYPGQILSQAWRAISVGLKLK